MRRPRNINCCYCLFAAACVLVASARAVADAPPYQARVIAAGAPVHSGPGENFYPTDTLAQGDVVDVYREKPGGWLAIRPPMNSFSWMSGRDLKLRDGGLAEVNKDDVASRVGSRLSDKHNAVQVRLKKGEVVEVVGEHNISGETWHKIAPPAGEFRWLQASLVERIGPIKPTSAETTAPANPTSTETKADATTTVAPATTGPVANNTVAPPLISNTQSTGSVALPPPSAPAPAASGQPAAGQPAGPVADDLSRNLTEIELRLSRMAAAPVNLWNTERLERDTAQLLNRAQTTAEREAVQATMNKISRFAQIGHRASPGSASVAQAGQPPLTPVPGSIAANVSGGPYDATGILRPVVSRRPGAPQYALVDERGQVLSFISPTPDINLQPYLGRQVGVVGNKGFIPEFNRSHVTAARVTPLGDRVLR